MENTELIEIIKDLLETPDHSQLLWQVEKRAIDLIDKLETKQLSIAAVSNRRELLLDWEKYRQMYEYGEFEEYETIKIMREYLESNNCG